MPRHPLVPAELRRRPFTVAEAREAGLTRKQLAGKAWRRLGPRTYVWAGLAVRPELLLDASRIRLRQDVVFAGWTAAWLHGLEGRARHPVEVIVAGDRRVSAMVGLVVRNCTLPDEDVTEVGPWRVTSVPRTLRDLATRLDLVSSVALLDAALHRGLLKMQHLEEWVSARAGSVGVVLLRRAMVHAEPLAESPMESRLRMLLVRNRLPRPEAQVEIRNANGVFAGRVDLYYRQRRLGIEYDGQTHRESLAEDDRRQNRLLAAGVQLLRFTSGDIAGGPDRLVDEVRRALRNPIGSRGVNLAS